MNSGLTLACMGGIDIVVILGVMVATGTGMLFFTYWPYRNYIRQLAQGRFAGRPLALFMASTVTAILWVFLTLGFLTVTFVSEILAVPVLILGAIGALGWVALLLHWLVSRKVSTRNPADVPAYQIWFQDLVIALFCYGLGLSILSAIYGMDTRHIDGFLGWAIYVFVAGSCGLLIAADICRFDRRGQNPIQRAAIFAAVFALFPLLLPLAIIGWWRWRRALLLPKA